jgi:hypothetical protein
MKTAKIFYKFTKQKSAKFFTFPKSFENHFPFISYIPKKWPFFTFQLFIIPFCNYVTYKSCHVSIDFNARTRYKPSLSFFPFPPQQWFIKRDKNFWKCSKRNFFAWKINYLETHTGDEGEKRRGKKNASEREDSSNGSSSTLINDKLLNFFNRTSFHLSLFSLFPSAAFSLSLPILCSFDSTNVQAKEQ